MAPVRGWRGLIGGFGALLLLSLGLAWFVAWRGPAEGASFVDDQADLIPAVSEQRLEALSRAVLEETGIELRTVTRASLGGGDLFDLSQELFDELAVGDRTGANRGLLLVIASAEERVRLAVSYELEELYPDAFVGYVEREQMAPYFRDGLVGLGIEATVELIAGRAFDRLRGAPGEQLAAAPPPGASRQGGAGAETAAPLAGARGSDRTPLEAEERPRYGPQPTPELAWNRFLEINRRHIKDPRLGLYDQASQELLLTRPSTDAGQDHLARLYSDAAHEIRTRGDRAAVVFPKDRDYLLAPWFFRRSAAGWQLDGTISLDVIGYNHRNQWRFTTSDHPYAFAFHDYVIDNHGFAQRRQ